MILRWATFLGVAFGVVEAAVVVYLRAIYYPDGFAFPLRDIGPRIALTELTREAATLLLLLAAAGLAAKRPMRRFAVFAFCFGVWDLVYYLGLYAFLGWPPSVLTWDVLFLIPVPWIAPVLAPVLVSLALIGMGVLVLREPPDRSFAFLRPRDWAVEIACGAAVLASFFVNRADAVPHAYPWWLFLAGWGGGVAWFAWRWSRRD
jgi:hypothetical protein